MKIHRLVLTTLVLTLGVLTFVVFGSAKVAYAQCSPSPSYGTDTLTVDAPVAGNYTSWIRVLSPDGVNNEVMMSVNGGSCLTMGATMPANTWTWVNTQSGSSTSVTVNLSEGNNTVVLYGNEPSVGIDNLIFSLGGSCTPTGTGSNCTVTPPPSVPTDVQASANSSTSVTVTWGASSDPSGPGLGGYYIYRNGTKIGSAAANVLQYTDNTASPNTTYSYTVAAYDIDGDTSAQSTPAEVTTPPTSGNYIEDKTFEDGLDGMQALSGCTVAQSNTKAHTGSFSLGVTGTGGAWEVQETLPGQATVVSGNSYDFTSWALAGSTSESISEQVTWVNSSGDAISTSNVGSVTDNSSGWSEITGSATAPTGAVNAALSLTSTAANGEVHYIDDMTVAGSNTNPNTNPPTTPTDLADPTDQYNTVGLSWTASTANGGAPLSGYYLIRDGVNIATIGATATTYSDNAVLPNTTYEYTIEAFNSDGIVSNPSPQLQVTTPNKPDSNPPTQPTNLAGTAVTGNQINLTWTACTDAVGIKDYKVFRDGTNIGTSTTTSFGDTGLTPDTQYTYYVVAVDTNLLKSIPSSSVTLSTQPPNSERGTVEGVVTIKGTHTAISGVYVHTGTHGTVNGMSTAYTNSSGQYVLLDVLSTHDHSFYWSDTGYKEYIISPLSVPAKQVTTLNVGLTPL